MTDSLGFRKKVGVVAPSTNTVVQPEFDAMRPAGVTNHLSRIVIPDAPVRSDEDFKGLLEEVRAALLAAVDAVVSCHPDYLVMGMSAETFWGGLEASRALQKRVEERAGVKVVMGAEACQAALHMHETIKRISVITPYMPVGDEQVERFFSECGFTVVRVKGLRCRSFAAISHVSERQLRDAIVEVNGRDVDAIVQVGTNLAMARLAGIAEFWLAKPVIAINTATYWRGLRQNGIQDRIGGFGSLLAEF